MRDYLTKLKSVCDSLASCGEIISEQEHVTAILNSLPLEYDSVITVITANPTPSDLRTVRTILLNAESRQVSLIDQYPVSANVVVQQQQQQTSSTHVFTASHAQSVQPAYTNPQQISEDRLVTLENTGYNTSDSNSGVYRGRGRGRFSSSRPQCQLCGKPGHLVERCYRRFDISFKNESSRAPQHNGNRAPQALYLVLGSDVVPSGNMVYYSAPVTHHVPQLPSQNQFVPTIVHSNPYVSFPSPIGSHVTSVTPRCGQLAQYLPTVAIDGSTMVQQASTPQALIATPEIVDDNAWYPDSGATHHLTKDIDNLQVGNTYPSTGTVQVGNGNTIPIHFDGQYVKDLVTKKVLLEGSKSGGLYQLNLSSFQSDSTANNHSIFLNKAHGTCNLVTKSNLTGSFPASFFFKQQRYLSPSKSSSRLQVEPSPSPHLHVIPSISPPHQSPSPSPHLHAIPSISPPRQSPSPSPHLHAIPSISPPHQSPSPSPHLHAIPSISPPHQSSSPSPHLHAIPSISPPHQVSPPSPQLHANPSVSPPL
ncbi:hypothetical protein GQ457_04G031130 [Hibiscus cannabinus]